MYSKIKNEKDRKTEREIKINDDRVKEWRLRTEKVSLEWIVVKEKFGNNDDQEEIKDERRRLKLSGMYDWKISEEI